MQAGPDQYTSDTMRLIAAWAGADAATVVASATAPAATPPSSAFLNKWIVPFHAGSGRGSPRPEVGRYVSADWLPGGPKPRNTVVAQFTITLALTRVGMSEE